MRCNDSCATSSPRRAISRSSAGSQAIAFFCAHRQRQDHRDDGRRGHLDEPDDGLNPSTGNGNRMPLVAGFRHANRTSRPSSDREQMDCVYRVNQLIPIDSSFYWRTLAGGKVYFINTQKVGNDKLLTKVGDSRNWSIWTTLTNTAKAYPDRFGCRDRRGAQRYGGWQRREGGADPDATLPARLPRRRPSNMSARRSAYRPRPSASWICSACSHCAQGGHTAGRYVRQSGLLKDRILIHHPTATTAEMALLKRRHAAGRR